MLRLLQTNPFPTTPPRLVRASLYNYTFTRWGDPSGASWQREFVAPYYPPTSLTGP